MATYSSNRMLLAFRSSTTDIPIAYPNVFFQKRIQRNYSIKSSTLDPPDVARLAQTARISLSSQEVEEFGPKIQQVVDWYVIHSLLQLGFCFEFGLLVVASLSVVDLFAVFTEEWRICWIELSLLYWTFGAHRVNTGICDSLQTTYIRFGQLQAVDLESIEPAIRSDIDGDNLRGDVPLEFENKDAIIAAIPNYDEPYIKVPKVLSKD